jgi:hypothetical protein
MDAYGGGDGRVALIKLKVPTRLPGSSGRKFKVN